MICVASRLEKGERKNVKTKTIFFLCPIYTEEY